MQNLLCIYILTINQQKGKNENNPIYNSIKKNKIPMNKLNQGGERSTHGKLYKTLKETEDINKWKNISCSLNIICIV